LIYIYVSAIFKVNLDAITKPRISPHSGETWQQGRVLALALATRVHRGAGQTEAGLNYTKFIS
jgi:hypothetical protein